MANIDKVASIMPRIQENEAVELMHKRMLIDKLEDPVEKTVELVKWKIESEGYWNKYYYN